MVSIITPIYNSELYLSETINSIINQTFENWELLLINDNSIDNSKEIAETYIKNDPRIKLVNLSKNQGAAVARNLGIEKAKGRFIAFLDSDDLWEPDKLEYQVDFMLSQKIPFTYSSYSIIDENNDIIKDNIVPESITYSQLLKNCIIGCLTVMYDSQKLGKVYFPLIRKRQDFALWLKILKGVSVGVGIKRKLARYRIRRESLSSNKLKAARYNWILYRQVEKLGFFKSLYYFVNYATSGIKKHFFKF